MQMVMEEQELLALPLLPHPLLQLLLLMRIERKEDGAEIAARDPARNRLWRLSPPQRLPS